MFDSEKWDAAQTYVEKDGVKLVHCDKCGADYAEGAFPFCRGNPKAHGSMDGFDDAFEPYVDIQLLDRSDPRNDSVNHLGMKGIWIGSRSQRRALMKELNLQYGTQKFDDKRSRVKYFFMK